ncbi:30S ribosome-binding factor RbfA [Candidatus Similichlamydia epinepheli]|uniref:30S ribosome-binding factor RbfA n=1 Tax=Candidatus Similichlamydia epinepheli TaxID=1903953 RepID=UPI000D39A921|nr:30S ribosome-binding factor RbfA [Candidatus Similichlamydia epinepheli]
MRRRKARLDSLLREVIDEVIRCRVADPRLSAIWTITEVDVSPDLRCARVGVSVLGSETDRDAIVLLLQSISKWIGVESSRRVRLRLFPSLQFFSDRRMEEAARLDEILRKTKCTS